MKIITRNFTRQLRQRLTEELNFLQIVVGPRQIGKTTGLKQIVKDWQGPSLMVTADELAAPSLEWLTLQWRRAKQRGRASLLVIDEIQKIPGWSQTIKYLFDQDRRALKVVLLGSASLSLRQGMQESLAGRYERIDAHHWNLAECRESLGWSLEEYFKFGGYPAAGELVSDLDRWQNYIRNSIIEPVLFKDILGLTSINKPALFRQTFELAMAYPAQEISLQKILGQLQGKGNVSTIKHYLELLEGAFLLKILYKYTGSEIRVRTSSPKIIPLNNALIHGFHNPLDIDINHDWRGRIFEATVGATLATRSKGKLYYWRDGKFEVDFVLELDNKLYAIEVKSGRRRNLHGLTAFVQRYPQSIPVIVDSDNILPLLQAENIDNLFMDGVLL